MKLPAYRFEEWCCPQSGSHARRFLPVPETPEEEELIAAYDEALMFSVRDVEVAKVRLMDGPTKENWEWVHGAYDRCLDEVYDHRSRMESAGCPHKSEMYCLKCEGDFHWHRWSAVGDHDRLANLTLPDPGTPVVCECGERMFTTGTNELVPVVNGV